MRPRRLILCCLLAAALPAACGRAPGPAGPAAPPAVPVAVAQAVAEDAPVTVNAIGNVESPASVMVRPQIAGRVAELLAPEGQDVKAGQPLLKFDAQPLEASLRQAEANLARTRAVAEDAHRLYARVKEAVETRALPARDAEDALAKTASADADVAAATAEVENSRLNLAYTTITAPFAGRLGRLLVKPGSIVKVNETDLVEITQTDPIEVSFAVPEEQLAAIRAADAKGPVAVTAAGGGERDAPASGTLSFLDSRVDPMTGTIRLKATFANADRRLWPGQFVTVALVLSREPGSIMVPDAAVQQTQSGPVVYVVKPDQTVEMRPVIVRGRIEGRSVIDKGVAAGETVVTDGQLRLGPGVKVQIKQPAPHNQAETRP